MPRSRIPSAVHPSGRYYTIPKACAHLGIPTYKVRRAVKLGLIPSHGVLNRQRYVILEEVQDVMAGRTTSSHEQMSLDLTGAEGGSR